MKKVTKKNAIKAYKVFDSNFKCRDYQFEVGKEYKHDGNIEICHSGFHSCLIPNNCFDYYSFNPDNKVAEVLIWGEIDKEEDGDSKRCSSHIKIVREITWQEMLLLVNTGINNTGRGNIGDRNIGDSNTGDSNTGNSNTGNGNTGNGNTGDGNTGDGNTGYRNTGDGNTGNWNACNLETGHFNSEQSNTIRVFNKPCDIDLWDECSKPDMIFFNQSFWIYPDDMSPEEKTTFPNYKTTNGYLKVLSYKDAFRKSWNTAKAKSNWESEYNLLINLPNFDAKVFEEISGIDVIKDK